MAIVFACVAGGLLLLFVLLGAFATDDINNRAEVNACETDSKTIKVAMVAWNTEYLGDNPDYATPWPPSETALASPPTMLLQDESDLHDLKGGGGDSPPEIVKADGECEDEGPIEQIS